MKAEVGEGGGRPCAALARKADQDPDGSGACAWFPKDVEQYLDCSVFDRVFLVEALEVLDGSRVAIYPHLSKQESYVADVLLSATRVDLHSQQHFGRGDRDCAAQ